ncbi:MAG: hypothetical protein ACU0CO_07775 [Shimia sp.]
MGSDARYVRPARRVRGVARALVAGLGLAVALAVAIALVGTVRLAAERTIEGRLVPVGAPIGVTLPPGAVVASILAGEGQWVVPGDPLVALDPAPLRARLEAERTALWAARYAHRCAVEVRAPEDLAAMPKAPPDTARRGGEAADPSDLAARLMAEHRRCAARLAVRLGAVEAAEARIAAAHEAADLHARRAALFRSGRAADPTLQARAVLTALLDRRTALDRGAAAEAELARALEAWEAEQTAHADDLARRIDRAARAVAALERLAAQPAVLSPMAGRGRGARAPGGGHGAGGGVVVV